MKWGVIQYRGGGDSEGWDGAVRVIADDRSYRASLFITIGGVRLAMGWAG